MRRVFIGYDVAGWATWRHAKGLQSAGHLCETDITVGSVLDYSRMGRTKLERYDAVYLPLAYCCRHPGLRRLVGLVASHGWAADRFDDRLCRTWGVTKSRNYHRAAEILGECDGAVCRNVALAETMQTLCPFWQVGCFPAGIQAADFSPPKRRQRNRRFRVGWCGNAAAGSGRSCKGLAEILVSLRRALPEIDWQVNCRDAREAFTTRRMQEWYRGLDVFLCTAVAEGTPNPPFEAAACGAVVLSTAVGAVADWRVLAELGLAVPPPITAEQCGATAEALAEKLRFLLGTDLSEFRRKLVESIRLDYDYRVLGPRILEYVAG